MRREYHKWQSKDLGREMEMLVFGHEGMPAIVFPTSQGRFFEFEDRGMVAAVEEKIGAGQLQLFCIDSVDSESWYNREAVSRQKIARQMQYEAYLLHDVLPLVRQKNQWTELISVGCSFGGYHAANMALRHPHLFSGCVSMSGAFDLAGLGFLHGPCDEDCVNNLPLEFVPRINDPQLLRRLRRNSCVLATGVHDQCWNDNERLAAALRAKEIPVQLDVWGNGTGHDWPWWKQMAQTYL